MVHPYLSKTEINDIKTLEPYLCKLDKNYFISDVNLNTQKEKYVEDTTGMMVLISELNGIWTIVEITEKSSRKELIKYASILNESIRYVVKILRSM